MVKMSDSKSFNVLNNFQPDKYNLLVPVQSIQEVNSIYRPVTNTVTISTNEDDKEIYEEKNAQGDAKWALTHKALLKLMTAANGQIVETVKVRPKVCEKCIDIVKATQQAPRCSECACNADVAYRATLKFPELSGGWRIVQATREINFLALAGMKEGQIRRLKEFAGEHAESKAINRCIRKGLSVKNAYTLKELEKPFVVAYPVLDARDPDVKKAVIAGAIASSNLLYGTGMMLTAGPQQALPEAQPPVDADYETEVIMPEQVQNPWEQQQQQRYFCSNPDCKVEIAQNVAEQSMKEFGFVACIKCQQLARKAGGK
jgi:hypothetical protein